MGQKIGMIGLGIMGSAMSPNLLKAGFSVVGYDILPQLVETLVKKGGTGAASSGEVAANSDVIITSLPSVEALQEVVSGKEGILAEANKGQCVIETSTLPLKAKQEAHDALSAVGVDLLDCPLSGTGAQAIKKDLVVYASGDKEVCKNCRSVFDGFARANYYLGEFGMGTKMKFVANLLVTIHNVSAAEAFVLGMKAGLDPEMMGLQGTDQTWVRGFIDAEQKDLSLAWRDATGSLFQGFLSLRILLLVGLHGGVFEGMDESVQFYHLALGGFVFRQAKISQMGEQRLATEFDLVDAEFLTRIGQSIQPLQQAGKVLAVPIPLHQVMPILQDR